MHYDILQNELTWALKEIDKLKRENKRLRDKLRLKPTEKARKKKVNEIAIKLGGNREDKRDN